MKKWKRLIFNPTLKINLLIICIITVAFFCLCSSNSSTGVVHVSGNSATIATRFSPPAGYERLNYPINSFPYFLKNLPLKPPDSQVHLYNKQLKANQQVHAAVIDLSLGTKDLQQCADAVIRLRAEYLFATGQKSKIRFHFTNGFLAEFAKWSQGYRIHITGNKVNWQKTGKADAGHASLLNFLDVVFSYAGTLSLSKELVSVEMKEMRPGDVFIKGGSPGHAVIVVDMAVDRNTGEKVFMLAQSYMPAQEIHVLKNWDNSKISPWYKVNTNKRIETPEWTFEPNQLKRFQ